MADLLKSNEGISLDILLENISEEYHDKCRKYIPEKEVKRLKLGDLRKDFISDLKDYLDYVDSFSSISPQEIASNYDTQLDYKQIASKTLIALHEFVEKDSTAKSDQYYGRIKSVTSSATKMSQSERENPGKTLYLPDKAAVRCIIDYVDYTDDTSNPKLNEAQNIRNQLEKKLKNKKEQLSSSPSDTEKKDIRKLEEKLILANDNLNILYHNDLCNRLIKKDSPFLKNLGAKVIPFRTRRYHRQDTGYVSDQFTLYFPEKGNAPGRFCEVQLKSSLRALLASKGLQAFTSISEETLNSIAKKDGAAHSLYKGGSSYPKESIQELLAIEEELKKPSADFQTYNSLIQKRTAIVQKIMSGVATYQYIAEGTNSVKEFSPYFNFLYHYENYLFELSRTETGAPIIDKNNRRLLKHQEDLDNFEKIEYFKDHMENRTILSVEPKTAEKELEK